MNIERKKEKKREKDENKNRERKKEELFRIDGMKIFLKKNDYKRIQKESKKERKK